MSTTVASALQTFTSSLPYSPTPQKTQSMDLSPPDGMRPSSTGPAVGRPSPPETEGASIPQTHSQTPDDEHRRISVPNSPKPSTVTGSIVAPSAADDSPNSTSVATFPQVVATPQPPLSPPTLAMEAAASTPKTHSELALLLAKALSDADGLRHDLAGARKRASRAERILSNFQGLSGQEVGAGSEAKNNISVDKNYTRMHESAVRAILEAEERAERAEQARNDIAHLLYTLSAHFSELERYEAACALRADDARSAFARTISSYVASHPATSHADSPQEDTHRTKFTVPAVLPPLADPSHVGDPTGTAYRSVPFSGPQYTYSNSLHGQPILSSYGSTSYPRAYGQILSQNHTQQNGPFHALSLPPPPSATGLANTGSNFAGASQTSSVPTKRARKGNDTVNGEWEEQKRRRLGGWEIEIESGPFAHPLHSRSSEVALSHSYERSQTISYPSTYASKTKGTYTPTLYTPSSGGGASTPTTANGYGYQAGVVRYGGHETGIGGDLGKVDAREFARDAKQREREYSRLDGRSYYRTAEPLRHTETMVAVEGRRRSRSRSSAGSSWSIDEMLLETATDREIEGRRKEDGRPSSIGQLREPSTILQYQSNTFAPPVTATHFPSSHGPSATHFNPRGLGSTYSIANDRSSNAGAVITSDATIGMSGKTSLAARQLTSLGPGGTMISNGKYFLPVFLSKLKLHVSSLSNRLAGRPTPAPATLVPTGGGFPAQNEQGQRICRQCGVAGRYKDGKCVEKWGPGPEGPGTVCDRCRKKMKRVERRGTMDNANMSQSVQRNSQSGHARQQTPIITSATVHSQFAHAQATSRQDTLLVDPHQRQPRKQRFTEPSPMHSHELEADRKSREGTSRSRSPVSRYLPSTISAQTNPADAPRKSHNEGQPSDTQMRSNAGASPSQSSTGTTEHRRISTPPSVNSPSARETFANGVSSERLDSVATRPEQKVGRDFTTNDSSLYDDGEGEDEERSEDHKLDIIDDTTPRWKIPHSHARHDHAHAEGQDELDSDEDADTQLGLDGSGSGPRSGFGNAGAVHKVGADGKNGTDVEIGSDADAEAEADVDADADADADAEITDAVDASISMKVDES